MIRKLWPYIIGSVALGLDAYVIAGLLPEIASDLHSSTSLIGLGVAAFTGAYAISGPLFAGAAGRRASQSLMLALGLFVVANLLTAASTSAPLFIITRLVAGAAAGIYSPLSSAVAAGTVGPERRGRALALVLAGLACGTVFGVPLGLLIAERVSWHLTFILIAGIGIAAMIGVGVRGHGQIANVEAPNFVQRLNTLRSARNLTTMLVTLLTGIASLGLYTYMIPMLEGMGHSSSQRWVIWVWGNRRSVGCNIRGSYCRLREELTTRHGGDHARADSLPCAPGNQRLIDRSGNRHLLVGIAGMGFTGTPAAYVDDSQPFRWRYRGGCQCFSQLHGISIGVRPGCGSHQRSNHRFAFGLPDRSSCGVGLPATNGASAHGRSALKIFPSTPWNSSQEIRGGATNHFGEYSHVHDPGCGT